MADQQVLWTAMPRSASADAAQLDVLVSPRLGVNAVPGAELQLTAFPELLHWTRTLADHLSFQVELADGSRHDAEVVAVEPLADDEWEHLFRPTTYVRPWKFRDFSTRPLHSYSIRFVTAYLRDLYVDIGRRFPTQAPPRAELDGFRETVGPVTDVRVEEERRPPPREEQHIPVPLVDLPPEPASKGQGCMAWLFRFLLWLLGVLIWLSKWLPARVGYVLRTLDRLLRQRLAAQLPVDPTRPKVDMPMTVHPSPYVTKPPIGPRPPGNPMAVLEDRMNSELVIAPSAVQGSMQAALEGRDVTFDFARAKRFHERPESETPPAAPPALPELDFHQAVAALGDYPVLMRRLGLLVRLSFTRPTDPPGSVRVIPLWDGATRESDVAPRTACVLADNHFHAAQPPTSDVAGDGLDLAGAGDRLDSDTGAFDLVQVDSDGAAMKAILAAATLERAHQLESLAVHSMERAAQESLPSLRSGGVSLVRADRAWNLHQHLVDALSASAVVPTGAGEPSSLAAELTIDHLVRGYRIEVRDELDAGWKSLCERVGTYTFVGNTGGAAPQPWQRADHGYVKRTSAASQAGDHTPMYVSEVLARWTGWSLVAPRPGKTLETKPAPGGSVDASADARSDAATEFRLETSFRAKNLPRLRFGHTYRVRAVCVDLGGGRLDAGTLAAASNPLTYRRFEPAGPPALLALRGFLSGESLERLVIRSDVGVDNPAYDANVLGASPADARAQRTRHLFPPKTSQQMAELHGMLEAAFPTPGGAAGDPDRGYRISLRESGSFSQELFVDVDTVDVDDPQRSLTFGTPQLVPANAGSPVPLAPGAGAPGAVSHEGYWVNRDDAQLPTPYLPDPVAAGTSLRGLPGLVDTVDGDPLVVRQAPIGRDDPAATEPVLLVPFDGDWPDRLGFRIRLAQGLPAGQPPAWDSAHRVLTVFLPTGERATVRYSSYLLPADLEQHGVWEWLDDGDPASDARAGAMVGAHWMISPPRELVLVHATQRPVRAARFTALEARRAVIGQTDAELANGILELHAPSTGRIDVQARWTEYLDDETFGHREVPMHSVAATYDVTQGWASGMAFPPDPADPLRRHELGDTRHRMIRYSVHATTAYREYLPAHVLDPMSGQPLHVDTPDDEAVEVSVLGSARPQTPGVAFAVPAFGWPDAPPVPGWATYEQTRRGGAIRIFLDRPWFSSGEGELLGVVLQAGTPLRDTLCSRLGLDATWAGRPAPEAPVLAPSDFVGVVDEDTVSLAETGETATVAGFSPVWDPERKQWYCDIELDVDNLPWSYWPFVRYAFVRFQPESLPDAKVSPVVLGDFGRVPPTRKLRLDWQGDKRHLRVRVDGRAPEAPHAPRLAVRVQETSLTVGTPADELDWTTISGHADITDDQGFFTLLEAVDPSVADGLMRWETVVELPVDRDAARMRLEVAEYELIRSDQEFGRGLARVTYAAHVELI